MFPRRAQRILAADTPGGGGGGRARGGGGRSGALLLGWGSASALSGPEPVPDTYGGRFVLSYAGQNTQVFNVSGCDVARVQSELSPTAIVKPCRFEVPANAASYL